MSRKDSSKISIFLLIKNERSYRGLSLKSFLNPKRPKKFKIKRLKLYLEVNSSVDKVISTIKYIVSITPKSAYRVISIVNKNRENNDDFTIF